MAERSGPPVGVHPLLEVPSLARARERVSLTLRIENPGPEPVELYLRGRTPAFDIIISTPDGTTVWQRLRNAVIPAVIRIEVLAPGSILELRESWDQRFDTGELVPAGTYIARGVLLTDSTPLTTQPRTFRIQPR